MTIGLKFIFVSNLISYFFYSFRQWKLNVRRLEMYRLSWNSSEHQNTTLMWGIVYSLTCQAGTELITGVAVPIPDPGANRGWVVSATPRPLYPQEKTRYPLRLQITRHSAHEGGKAALPPRISWLGNVSCHRINSKRHRLESVPGPTDL